MKCAHCDAELYWANGHWRSPAGQIAVKMPLGHHVCGGNCQIAYVQNQRVLAEAASRKKGS